MICNAQQFCHVSKIVIKSYNPKIGPCALISKSRSLNVAAKGHGDMSVSLICSFSLKVSSLIWFVGEAV